MRYQLLPILCCWLGFVLRIRHLGGQSFWLDEGGSYWFAVQPLATTLRQSFGAEPNPPLYYTVLHFWVRLAGESEFSLRFLSLLVGTLLVAAVYRLGKNLHSPLAGGLAALVTAASPFLVWYSQEARMYALLATTIAVASLCLWRALWPPASFPYRFSPFPLSPSWVAFFVLALAALYTHLYAVFFVAGAGVLATLARMAIGLPLTPGPSPVGQERGAHRRGEGPARSLSWRTLVVVWGGLAVLYLPWLASALQHDDPSANWRGALTAADVLGRTLAALSHGGFAEGVLNPALVIGFGLLVLVGLVGRSNAYSPSPLPSPQGRGGRRALSLWERVGVRVPFPSLFLFCLLVLPLLAIAVLSPQRALFAERYVIGLAPFFYLALGLGAARLGRQALGSGPALVGVLLLGSGLIFVQVWDDDRPAKEDFRSAARYVERYGKADDLVVLVADYVRLPFAYYYRAGARVVPYAGDYQQPAGYLAGFTAGRRNLWLVLSHADQVDPQGKVRGWLGSQYPLATEQYPRGIHLLGYNLAYRREGLPAEAVPQQLDFGGRIRLVGYQADAVTTATDRRLHPPSNWVHVILYWQAQRPLEESYRTQVKLVDGRGIWGVKLDRPGETTAFYPTNRWVVGEVVVDEVDVNLNPATPPGTYHLEVGLVSPGGEPLPVEGGSASIGMVEITK